MKLQQGLKKEDFFNEMNSKFPKAMEEFCKWVDRYKEAVGWSMLFNSESNYQNAEGKNAPAPKYHNIPYAMQLGIWITNVTSFENSGDYLQIMLDDKDSKWYEDLEGMIDCFFSIRQEELTIINS